MAKTDYAALAPRLLEQVGGEANISSMSHCATRMRFVLKDESKAATESIKELEGVVTVVQAGGQYQVIIGNDVPVLDEELGRITALGQQDEAPQGPGGELPGPRHRAGLGADQSTHLDNGRCRSH